MISNLSVHSIHLLFECIDIVLLMSNCGGVFPQVETSLVESAFLDKITLGFFRDMDLPTITTGYMILLNRIILCDASFFINYISFTGESCLQLSKSDMIKLLLEKMEKKATILMNKIQSRMCGMAAITLITTEDIDVIKNTHIILSILSTVFEDAELICTDE